MEDISDVEAAPGINAFNGGLIHDIEGAATNSTCITVVRSHHAPQYVPPSNIAEIFSSSRDFNVNSHLRHDTPPMHRKSSIDAAASSGSASSSWLSLLSSGGDYKKRLDPQRSNIAALHLADNALSGRVTANSGVSFCISKSSVQSPILEATQQQNTSNASSAMVEPAPHSAGGNIATADLQSYTANRGMVLTFVDVGYTLAKKRRRHSKWASSGKQILHGITGCVMPGEMLALMGPSGSGKTTLLNVLGGRNEPESVNTMKGVILYDGAPYSKNLKPRLGFVTQDDMLYPHLTVKETLTYAALLRLPASMSRKQKIDKADQVIRQLGLERCRDTVIGNAFLRGVSGGERKRVCIGHEILIDPSLIFLDEPTSGLDSTTALRIMHLLQGLAQAGRSVVTTIHQPSSRVFYLFDKLLLLAEGHCVYFGKASNAMQYFEAQGFAPLVPMNPADFLLDVCSGNTYDMKVPIGLGEEDEEQEAGMPKMTILTKDVVQYLLESDLKDKVANDEMRQGGLPFLQKQAQVATGERQRVWAVGWGTQVAVLLERGLKERRHDYLGWLKVTQVMATALLCGTLWWHSNTNSPSNLEDQVGLLFFIGLFWGFFPLFNAIFTFPLERALLAKERSSDMYRLSAYFVARSMSDLPLDLLLPTCFLTLVYFMATLRMSVASFSFSMLVVHLTVITAQGAGLLIGAVMMDVKNATTFGSVLVIALMLAAGFFVQRIPKCVAWIKYFSFQSYCYRLLVKIQYYPYYDIHICSNKEANSIGCRRVIALNRALHGMQLRSGVEEVWCLLVLSLLSRFLAYLALRQLRINSIGKRIKLCVCSKGSKHP